MKYCITALLLISIITSSFAQASAYTVNNLTPELVAITENVKAEVNLNPDQFKKFKADYVLFLNENAKPNANTNTLFMLLGLKIRGYMNEAQFSKITQMVKDGKLNPPDNKTVLLKPENTQKVSVTSDNDAEKQGTNLLSPSVANQSNVTVIFEQLKSFMKITPEKAAQLIPILKDYDKAMTKIKTENSNNAAKLKQQSDALNGQVVPKLKAHMTDEQLGSFIVALSMQENILSGKNLSADQKVFLDKLRSQYGLNEVQTMSVILVLVQGKVRGDAIGLISKSNPQLAGQEFITLLQDLDKQLKTSLTNDQYINVKSDIEKLLKGEKI